MKTSWIKGRCVAFDQHFGKGDGWDVSRIVWRGSPFSMCGDTVHFDGFVRHPTRGYLRRTGRTYYATLRALASAKRDGMAHD